jgi:hypothetical protein
LSSPFFPICHWANTFTLYSAAVSGAVVFTTSTANCAPVFLWTWSRKDSSFARAVSSITPAWSFTKPAGAGIVGSSAPRAGPPGIANSSATASGSQEARRA